MDFEDLWSKYGTMTEPPSKTKLSEFLSEIQEVLDKYEMPECRHSSSEERKQQSFESNVPDLFRTFYSEERAKNLSSTFDELSKNVGVSTCVDPTTYLKEMESLENPLNVTTSEIENRRRMLRMLRKRHPNQPLIWILAARLEHVTGHRSSAMDLILLGCANCPENENIWLEASRLATSLKEAKSVIRKAVKAMPNSVNIWLQASVLETEEQSKIGVLKQGIKCIPDSERLWKALVDLSNEEDAKVYLKESIRRCPYVVDLWLGLARLEDYTEAKLVLGEARKSLPKEAQILIYSARLEEANGNQDVVKNLIQTGITELLGAGAEIKRESWMLWAELAERAGSIATCQAIIENTIGYGVEEDARKGIWVADAEAFKQRGSIEAARAVYYHTLSQPSFLKSKSVWLKLAQLEKSHGTLESLEDVMYRAILHVPSSEALWLLRARSKWLAGDVKAADKILQEASKVINSSQEIWHAMYGIKLEKMKPESPQSVHDDFRNMLDERLKMYGMCLNILLLRARFEERIGCLPEARKAYALAVKKFPNSCTAWISLADVELKLTTFSAARAILTQARMANPHSSEIWLETIEKELSHGSKRQAEFQIEKALRECPSSGSLWAKKIEMVSRSDVKKTVRLAYNNCREDPHIAACLGKLFWKDGKVQNARDRLNQAVNLGPDVGDFWGLLYKFEMENGTTEQQAGVVRKFIAAEPTIGKNWQPLLQQYYVPLIELLQKLKALV